MPIAKKATKADALIKLMAWGDPGAGKTRMALSFPAPLLIDLERGSRLYADDFDFMVAEPTPTLNAAQLVAAVTEEIERGEYPEVGTLIIDPITDYLDALESLLVARIEKEGVNLDALKGPAAAKVRARIKDGIKERLQRLLGLPVHIVFVARAKNQWGNTDKGLAPIGRTYDANDIVEYLCDVVLQLHKGGNAKVIKSRLADLPDTIKSATFRDIQVALEAKPAPVMPEEAAKAARAGRA